MATPQPPVIPPDVAKLTGPLLLGQFFNWGLFGVLTVQVYFYYLAFPSDRQRQHSLVLCIFALEAIQTLLGTSDGFRILATGWGNVVELDKVGALWFSYPLLNTIVSFIVQLFYAWRIYVLSINNMWLPIIVATLSVVQFIAGAYEASVTHRLGSFSQLATSDIWSGALHLTGSAVCDVVIVVGMSYYLDRSKIGFRRFNALLGKLVRITVETGFLCMALAIVDMALFFAYRRTNYHTVPASVLSKIYSNSLLVVLNTRARMTGDPELESTNFDQSMSLSFYHPSQFQHTTRTMDLVTDESGTCIVNRAQYITLELLAWWDKGAIGSGED
ncbi:hypothetical protein K474DRAFT_1673070 [Panus rudis PR-1116 ss-1]|nr:hypothetical protein K474DRAFT_1673070 [Panus rudis PR-1116 ss-1]